MTDESLDTAIRSALARRDPGRAAPGLEAAVVARVRADPRRGRLSWIGGPILRLGTLAVTVLIVAVALSLGSLRPTGPAASASPLPVSSPGIVQAGDGIVDQPPGPVIQALLAVAVLVGLAGLGYRTRNRAVLVGAVLGIMGIVWVWSMIGRGDALTTSSGSFGAQPIVLSGDPTRDGYTIRATGDTRFEVVFTVTNESELPVRLQGLRDQHEFPGYIGPRYTGLGAWQASAPCCLPEDAVPFQPVTIPAHGMLDLVVIGQTGPCATPPQAEGGDYILDSVPLVYEQLTIGYSVDVPLRGEIRIPTGNGCPAASAQSPEASGSP